MDETTCLDDVLRGDPVELEVLGEAVHAAPELDLGVHLVREGLALDARPRPLQHRLEPARGRSALGMALLCTIEIDRCSNRKVDQIIHR